MIRIQSASRENIEGSQTAENSHGQVDERGFFGTYFPAISQGASDLLLGRAKRWWPPFSWLASLADPIVRITARYIGAGFVVAVGFAYGVSNLKGWISRWFLRF